jgi:hypothetical protein
MDWEFSIHKEGKEMHIKISVDKSERKRLPKRLGIILKWILKE